MYCILSILIEFSGRFHCFFLWKSVCKFQKLLVWVRHGEKEITVTSLHSSLPKVCQNLILGHSFLVLRQFEFCDIKNYRIPKFCINLRCKWDQWPIKKFCNNLTIVLQIGGYENNFKTKKIPFASFPYNNATHWIYLVFIFIFGCPYWLEYFYKTINVEKKISEHNFLTS